MYEFTQGVWGYKEYVPEGVTVNGYQYIIGSEGETENSDVDDIALVKREHDARLIAAAPELYRILRNFCSFIHAMNGLFAPLSIRTHWDDLADEADEVLDFIDNTATED